MEFLSQLREQLADDRVAANLVAFYGLIVLAVIVSLVLRRLLTHGGNRLARTSTQNWVHGLTREVVRHGRSLLFWGTLAAVALTMALGMGYHLLGGDVRREWSGWVEQWTARDLLRAGLALAGVLGLALTTRLVIWTVRRIRPVLEKRMTRWLQRRGNEETLRRWFALAERYAVAALRLSALWGAGYIVGLGEWAKVTVGFVLLILTTLVVARLLTLACKILTRTIADVGDRHLARGHFRRYWERITRLFPFGERCFEAAVWVSATSLCVGELHFISVIATFGPRIVECIGILFGTRVVIELLQVLLNEAFGMYDDTRRLDQKGRTLVPLLQSVCQYVLYFGSGVLMLEVLGLNTMPILAGAGILGLGVGLGAQSLVTDLVSGFFILFEAQYLVGDYVQIGDAAGTVESVGIRLTQIRDVHGKLHLIPNGQIKGVINYSKGYVNAVVDWKVPSGSDLEAIFLAMTEAGRLLREEHPDEVLADTELHGLVELGTSEMTVRAVTRVQPGTHGMMQSQYRRLLKQVFDRKHDGKGTALAA